MRQRRVASRVVASSAFDDDDADGAHDAVHELQIYSCTPFASALPTVKMRNLFLQSKKKKTIVRRVGERTRPREFSQPQPRHDRKLSHVGTINNYLKCVLFLKPTSI